MQTPQQQSTSDFSALHQANRRSPLPILQKAFSLLASTALASSLLATLILPTPAQADDTNGCGPENMGLLVPDGPFPFLSYFDAFATFEEACNNHDKCYVDTSISQVECDRRMYAEMLQACANDFSGIFLSYCQSTAGVFHSAVSEYGEMSKLGVISGKIVDVTTRRIRETFSDDEFEACADITNDGMVNTEFDLVLYATDGDKIDTEPDTYEINLAVGEGTEICVGTDGIYPSISDLGQNFKLVLRVDHPEHDFISIDEYVGRTP